MKKHLLTLTVLLSAAAFSHAIQPGGILGSYVGLNKNSTGNVWYGAEQPGANFLTNFDGLSIGTFNPGAGDTLVLTSGELNTWVSGTTVTGAFINWRINQLTPTTSTGSFAAINLGFTSNATFSDEAGNSFTNAVHPGNQKWANIASTPNLLTGLSNGTYGIEIFYNATTGIDFNLNSNNSGSNFKATFAVVPEPSTVSLLLGSSLFAGLFLLRKKRSQLER